jgi:hypothetical protein
MLEITKNNDGTIKVWLYDYETNLSVSVCTPPDKLAATLPRDVLAMVRELVIELENLLPLEPPIHGYRLKGTTPEYGRMVKPELMVDDS